MRVPFRKKGRSQLGADHEGARGHCVPPFSPFSIPNPLSGECSSIDMDGGGNEDTEWVG